MQYSDYSIGVIARNLRIAKKLTLLDCAHKCAMTTSTYNRVENGEVPFHLRDFLKYCEALEINPYVFLKKLKKFKPKVLI